MLAGITADQKNFAYHFYRLDLDLRRSLARRSRHGFLYHTKRRRAGPCLQKVYRSHVSIIEQVGGNGAADLPTLPRRRRGERTVGIQGGRESLERARHPNTAWRTFGVGTMHVILINPLCIGQCCLNRRIAKIGREKAHRRSSRSRFRRSSRALPSTSRRPLKARKPDQCSQGYGGPIEAPDQLGYRGPSDR